MLGSDVNDYTSLLDLCGGPTGEGLISWVHSLCIRFVALTDLSILVLRTISRAGHFSSTIDVSMYHTNSSLSVRLALHIRSTDANIVWKRNFIVFMPRRCCSDPLSTSRREDHLDFMESVPSRSTSGALEGAHVHNTKVVRDAVITKHSVSSK